MFPTLYQTPSGVGIHTYGLFIVLALSSAFLLVNARASRVGIHPDKLIVNYLAAGVGGMLGARLLYVVAVVGLSSPVVLWLLLGLGAMSVGLAVRSGSQGWSTNQLMMRMAGVAVALVAVALVGDAVLPGDRPSLLALGGTFLDELFSTGQGGFAYYGGVIGGAVAVLFTCSLMGLDGWKAADLAAPAVVLGYGVGRIGCFFAGCCHGVIAPVGEAPLALLPDGLLGGQLWLSSRLPFLTSEFHTGVGGILHTPLYPTQIWQSASGFLLAGFLAWFWTRRRFDGQVAAVTLIIEPPFRAFSEAFRADQRGYAFTFPVSPTLEAWLPGLTQAGAAGEQVMGVTTSQGLGFAAMALGVVLLVVRRGAGRDAEVDDRSRDEAILDQLMAD
jgi:prolipoprotein diacylglyceryltransferase